MSSIITFLSNPVNLVLIVALVSIFLLGLRIWRSDPKNPSNIFASLASFGGAFWLVGVLGYRNAGDPLVISLAARLIYVMPLLGALSHHLFTYYFPKRLLIYSKRYFIILFSTAFLLLIITLLPDVFISGHLLPEERFNPEVSLLWHIVFVLYYTSVTVLSVRNLVLQYRVAVGVWRARVKQVMIGTLVVHIGAPIVGIVIPIFLDHRFEWVAAFPIFFLACYIWYNIFWKPGRVPKQGYIYR